MAAADTTDDLSARLAAVERRLAALEAAQGAGDHSEDGRSKGNQQTGQFWALDTLRTVAPDTGGVVFAGIVQPSDHERYEWQHGRPTDALLDEDWSATAPTLAALAHPVRLRLLRAVLRGSHAIADLQTHVTSGTSGQLYHHLRQLVSAGWLHLTGRGTYAVPAERVVPLLTILAAAQR